ncbi:MAG TPA: hypothetical protein VNM92_02910 [Thermoanaerobaculia bacterium]|nr:hypothetical protein [Thermoanaerobaculia bacterium]
MTHHEHHVDWRVLLFYGLVCVVVLGVGAVVLYTYFERQTLAQGIVPEPLPKVMVITGSPDSKFVSSWVGLMTKADFSPTLVPIERVDALQGVLVITNIATLPEKVAGQIDAYVQDGRGVVVIGAPPRQSSPFLDLVSTDSGMSETRIQMAEAASPLMARMNPGHELLTRPAPVAFIDETPQMIVDARWKVTSRAAVAHYSHGEGRVVWLGFDPAALTNQNDVQLNLLLRTAFRWAAGQPVSDGAVGAPAAARTLTPEARLAARTERFAFSVEKLRGEGTFSVRLTNRGKKKIENPTVKLWLPARVKNVKLAGSFILRRKATLIGVPQDGTVLVMLPALNPNEDRTLKLKVTATN